MASGHSQQGATPTGVIDGETVDLVLAVERELSPIARVMAIHRPDLT